MEFIALTGDALRMTSKVELVSVIIPTLNEAGTIKEAITTINQDLSLPQGNNRGRWQLNGWNYRNREGHKPLQSYH